MTEPLLLESDRQSATWLKLKACIESRIVTHQRAIERDRPEVDTAKIRGRLAELRWLLEAAEPTNVERTE